MSDTNPTPAPTSTPAPTETKSSWLTVENIKTVAIIVLLLFSSLGGYAYKQTKSELLTEQTKNKQLTESTSSNSDTVETDTPVIVGGKLAYAKKIEKVASKTLKLQDNTESLSLTDKKKETSTVKTTFALGPAFSTSGAIGVDGSADVFYLGIGTLRLDATVFEKEQIVSPQLNLYF